MSAGPVEPSRRELLLAGAACFERGAYFEAHERWEDAWRTSTGKTRRVIQGMVQIAAGFVHHERQRPRPAAVLWRHALAKLDGAPAELDGVDLAGLAGRARDALAESAPP